MGNKSNILKEIEKPSGIQRLISNKIKYLSESKINEKVLIWEQTTPLFLSVDNLIHQQLIESEELVSEFSICLQVLYL